MENLTATKNENNTLRDLIINDSETKIRVGIKEVEERVKNETKFRKINAPLTSEEKILMSL